ncbi:MAG: hypothetical protein AAGH70_06550 [Pseudomonadota bacterium]
MPDTEMRFRAMALVVTDNMIEAADLVDSLSDVGLRPAQTLRDAGEAYVELSSGALTPGILVIGHRLSLQPAQSLLSAATQMDIPTLVLDGKPEHNSDMVVSLARPFTTANVQVAVSALKFPDPPD